MYHLEFRNAHGAWEGLEVIVGDGVLAQLHLVRAAHRTPGRFRLVKMEPRLVNELSSEEAFV
jgi:hypothetical protein